MQWDIFCRVIDNFGDIGVCWRLASDLARHGQQVRLWVDDPHPLQWMAPAGEPGVLVHEWNAAAPQTEPGDVVVEAFGCDPAPSFVEKMSQRLTPPVWINLEYLSAEDYVERSHGLRSPQLSGLNKWFFYPGFTAQTGGLIHEDDMPGEMRGVQRSQWLASQGIAMHDEEFVVSVFCYAHAQPLQCLQALPPQPTLVLTAPGAATSLLEHADLPPHIRYQPLPWLSQTEYDTLLCCCDLNLVRGEDSFVRAQWAGRPFLWNIYAQEDGVHQEKLNSFLARFLHGAPPSMCEALRALMLTWNGIPSARPAWPNRQDWLTHTLRWRNDLLQQESLTKQLLAFVLEKR
jgi:uncharacterized repeat protein (TIGR03837 family)